MNFSAIKNIIEIVILSLLLFSVNNSAQDYLEKQLESADRLFEQELYFDAVTEYKRLAYFDRVKRYQYHANLRIGQSYKMGGFYDKAIEYLSNAEFTSNNSGQRFTAKFEIVRVNILRRTGKRALQILDEIEADIDFVGDVNELNYWRGWSYIMENKWKRASRYFALIDSTHELKNLCDEIYRSKYSVTFAKTISYILPGSGQFYTGNYTSGAVSLFWHLLWGYTTISAFADERLLDGLLVGNFLWLRFYRGSNQNSENFVEEKNKIVANRGYRYLKNQYRGLKP